MSNTLLRVRRITIPDTQRKITTVDFVVDNGRISKRVRDAVSGKLGRLRSERKISYHEISRQSLCIKVPGTDVIPDEITQICFAAFGEQFLLEDHPDHDPRSAHRKTPPLSSYIVSQGDSGRYHLVADPNRDLAAA